MRLVGVGFGIVKFPVRAGVRGVSFVVANERTQCVFRVIVTGDFAKA